MAARIKHEPIEVGQQVGEWTVVESGSKRLQKSTWVCQCSCGNIRTVFAQDLNRRKSIQCGPCARTKHGCADSRGDGETPEYQCYQNMKSRCLDRNHPQFANYGGRGITICQRWLDSVENFLTDVGTRPSPLHSIDRYPNNDGNYEPGNIRWATRSQQNRNTRATNYLTIDGVTKPLSDWCDDRGVSQTLVNTRIRRGWNQFLALTTPRKWKRSNA